MTALLAAPFYADWLVRTLRDAAGDERAALYRSRLADATAVPVAVVRHQCPHCRRTWAKQAAAKAHVARCWKNPDVRSCKTCVHFEPFESGRCWGDPYCNCPDTPEGCAAGVPLGDALAVDCPMWRALEAGDLLPAPAAGQ